MNWVKMFWFSTHSLYIHVFLRRAILKRLRAIKQLIHNVSHKDTYQHDISFVVLSAVTSQRETHFPSCFFFSYRCSLELKRTWPDVIMKSMDKCGAGELLWSSVPHHHFLTIGQDWVAESDCTFHVNDAVCLECMGTVRLWCMQMFLLHL